MFASLGYFIAVPPSVLPFVQKGGYPDTPLTNSFLKKIYINNPR